MLQKCWDMILDERFHKRIALVDVTKRNAAKCFSTETWLAQIHLAHDTRFVKPQGEKLQLTKTLKVVYFKVKTSLALRELLILPQKKNAKRLESCTMLKCDVFSTTQGESEAVIFSTSVYILTATRNLLPLTRHDNHSAPRIKDFNRAHFMICILVTERMFRNCSVVPKRTFKAK